MSYIKFWIAKAAVDVIIFLIVMILFCVGAGLLWIAERKRGRRS